MLATKAFQLGPLPRRAHPRRSDRSILRLLLDALASDLRFSFQTSCLVSACGPVRKREEAVLRFASVRDQEHLSPRPVRLRGAKWSLCSKWGSRGEGLWGGRCRSWGLEMPHSSQTRPEFPRSLEPVFLGGSESPECESPRWGR